MVDDLFCLMDFEGNMDVSEKKIEDLLVKNPNLLDIDGKNLIIIQRQYAGFSNTKERLDLLALDGNGNLVIIEIKKGGDNKTAILQALKYASYCAQLTTENIVKIYGEYLKKEGKSSNFEEAKNRICSFLDIDDIENLVLNEPKTQRIVLVANSFSNEVTNSVLWLMDFDIQIECFKSHFYRIDNKKYASFERIIPLKDQNKYTIKMEKKMAEEKMKINQNQQERIKKLKDAIHKNSILSMDEWKDYNYPRYLINKDFKGLNFANLTNSWRVEFFINHPNPTISDSIFKYLEKSKAKIEAELGFKLKWEAKTAQSEWAKRISYSSEWDDSIENSLKVMIQKMIKLREVLGNYLEKWKK